MWILKNESWPLYPTAQYELCIPPMRMWMYGAEFVSMCAHSADTYWLPLHAAHAVRCTRHFKALALLPGVKELLISASHCPLVILLAHIFLHGRLIFPFQFCLCLHTAISSLWLSSQFYPRLCSLLVTFFGNVTLSPSILLPMSQRNMQM